MSFSTSLNGVFWNIKRVIVIADDIMIVGKKPNYSNHDQALETLLEIARRYNVWLNYEKSQCKKQEIDCFGKMYTTSGCKPDKNKVTAITKIPAPTNKKQVQSFIGMINYLSQFSARLSEFGGAHQRIGKGHGIFQLGHRTSICL